MDGGARHVFGIAKQLEIFQGAIAVVAVLPPNAVSFRNRAVGIYPDPLVYKFPVAIRRARAVVRLVVDFANQVAIWIELHRADRTEFLQGRPPALAFLELSFRHAPRSPARAARAFVRRNVSFRETMGGAELLKSYPTFTAATLHVFARLAQAQAVRALTKRKDRRVEAPRQLGRRMVGIEFA